MPRISNQHLNRLAEREATDFRVLFERNADEPNVPAFGGLPDNQEFEANNNFLDPDPQDDMDVEIPNDDDDGMSHFSDYSHEVAWSSDEENDVNDHEEIKENIFDIREELRIWASSFRVAGNAVTALLKILKNQEVNKHLPATFRTLKGTPRETITKPIEPGHYAHFGILRGLKKVVSEFKVQEDTLSISVNGDGIGLYKSSGTEIWALQGHCAEAPTSSPFFIGIWEGRGKPKDFNLYLEDFVEEAKILYQDGVIIDGKKFQFKILNFLCDAPARAAFTGIKGHTGKHGCGKCKQVGCSIRKHVAFSTEIAQPRQDADFEDMEDLEHHLRHTILTELPVGLVTCFPHEPQHLVHLGGTRKLIQMWKHGKHLPCRLSNSQQQQISQNLEALYYRVPSEFQRKPRTLQDLKYWKATEYRQFLLYTGPVVLKGVISKEYYDHFMTFHTAILILSSPKYYAQYNDDAAYLLSSFVKNFAILYGREHVSYNIHGLLHLSEDALRFGPLDQFSTFKFENHFQLMKKLLKSSKLALQQISNRLIEDMNIIRQRRETRVKGSFIHNCGPTLDMHVDEQYKKLETPQFVIRLNDADNIFELKNGGIFKVENIIKTTENQYFVIGKKLKQKGDFYNFPCDSSTFGIYRLTHELGERKAWKLSDIKCKMVCLPYKSKDLVAYPMLHTSF